MSLCPVLHVSISKCLQDVLHVCVIVLNLKKNTSLSFKQKVLSPCWCLNLFLFFCCYTHLRLLLRQVQLKGWFINKWFIDFRYSDGGKVPRLATVHQPPAGSSHRGPPSRPLGLIVSAAAEHSGSAPDAGKTFLHNRYLEPEARKDRFTKHQLCMHLFLCPRLIRFPNSFTDSHIRITGPGIRTRGSPDPPDFRLRPGRSSVPPPPPKVWASQCGSTAAPSPTPEAPRRLWSKTLDSQLRRSVGEQGLPAEWRVDLRTGLKHLFKTLLIFLPPVSQRAHQ